MREPIRHWQVEYANGEVAFINAYNKRTAILFAECEGEEEDGYIVVKIAETDW